MRELSAARIRRRSGRQDIFRITGAVKRSPAVDLWMNGEPVELRSIARKWFAQMRECGEDVLEAMHDGCPVACIEDAPFGYVNSFRSHVNVGFFYGAMIADPAGLLEGTGKRMRHVKLRPGLEPSAAALSDLIAAAYVDIKARGPDCQGPLSQRASSGAKSPRRRPASRTTGSAGTRCRPDFEKGGNKDR